MEKAKGLTSSRRDFLKASGLALLGSAAAAGAFSAVPAARAYAEGEAAAATPAEAGIANFETDMYSDVFPTNVRYVPVIDAPTDMDRQGKVAFELREIGEDEIVRTEETDVLVAGCGITGVCAALSASDDGTTQVLCLEKMSEGRGMFEGMGVTGGAAMAAADYVCDKPPITACPSIPSSCGPTARRRPPTGCRRSSTRGTARSPRASRSTTRTPTTSMFPKPR